MTLKLGTHELPAFDGASAVFGASGRDYPKYDQIPAEFREHHNRFQRVFSALFFRGGKLDDHGLKIKKGVDAGEFYTALRALMSSFDPKQELKAATVAWLLSEYTTEA